MSRKHVVLAVASLACGLFFSFGCNNPVEKKDAITITAPLAGAKLLAGDTLDVKWDKAVANAAILYNNNKGLGWQAFTNVTKVNDMEAKVVLPARPYADSFQVKVADNGGTYDPGISGLTFLKWIILTYPVGGEIKNQGDTVVVTWRATADIGSVRVQLTTDDGRNMNDLSSSSLNPAGNYVWKIGTETPGLFSYPSTTCRIWVQEYNNTQVNDISGNFTVN